MNENNSDYKKQISKIGSIMLLYFGLSVVLPIISMNLQKVIELRMADVKMREVICELMDMAVYIIMFMCPLFVYRAFDRRYTFDMMPCRLKLSKYLPLLIPAIIALNYAASCINSVAVVLINPNILNILPESTGTYSGYNFILNFISIAIIPPFVEELLFRGLILDRLVRFGRLRAIIISSLLFALMHQNPLQIFYTFIAGCVLGYLFLETGSVWSGIVVHFCINLSQVIMDAISSTQPEARATFIQCIIQLVFIAVGLITGIYYFVKHGKKRIDDEEWLFGAEEPTSKGYAIKGFFRPTMIVFVSLSIGAILLLLMMNHG